MFRLIFGLTAAMVAIFGLAPMAVLTADRNTESKIGDLMIYPVGVDIIYKGAIVMVDDAGFLIAGADSANGRCVGVADEKVDNSGGSAGDLNCRVVSGRKFRFMASSITQAMLGDAMFIVDDQTFDDAAGPTNDVPCGRLVEYISATEGWIFIPKGGCRKANIAAATYDATEQTLLNDLIY